MVMKIAMKNVIKKIKILAIETASEACSASLLVSDENGELSSFNQFESTPRQHAKLILSMLDEVLEEGGIALKDVDAIAFGRGPGAFTGLRIATGVAQGVALSVDKLIVPISTLAALALQAVDLLSAGNNAYDNEIIAVANDARMGEVYLGLFSFNEGKIELIGEEQASKPSEVFIKISKIVPDIFNQKIITIGSGWEVYEDEISAIKKPAKIVHMKNVYPNASAVAKLALPLLLAGKTVSPEDAQPVYIRNDVAKKSQKQKKLPKTHPFF